MKVLILHHNFPGQFAGILEICEKKDYEATFVCETNYKESSERIRIEVIGQIQDNGKSFGSINSQMLCAKNFYKKMRDLEKENYRPDIIVSHSGWGCGLYAKAIFPESKLICYCEWWFKYDAAEYHFKENKYINYSEAAKKSMYLRNLPLAAELAEADELITPTNWQKSQFPNSLGNNMHVIHEGVDINFFVQNRAWKSPDRCVITYATRGMEPMRGFTEMIIAMNTILNEYDHVDLIIAGEDKIFYGANKGNIKSFGAWAKIMLEKHINKSRVKFMGRLEKQKYARLLKTSDIHLYFTRPFVASWSLLEAMSSGCFLVTSDVKPVRELIGSSSRNIIVDHTNEDSLLSGIRMAVGMPRHQRLEIGLENREIAKSSFSRRMSLEKWGDLLEN